MATATLNAVNKTSSKDEAEIRALVEAMLRANHDKDATAFAAAFAQDAAVFNLAPPLVHHGINIDEKGPVSFWMRETLCLERIGGDWKIVHEHTSVPFYMDSTLRPAFDLEP